MGQNAGYFNKTNQLAILFSIQFQKEIFAYVKLFIVVHEQTPWIWFVFYSIQNSHVHERANSLKICSICILLQEKPNLKSLSKLNTGGPDVVCVTEWIY